MKKLLMFAVLATLAFTAVACGPTTPSTTKKTDPTTAATTSKKD